MIRFFKELWKDRRGNALLIAAASMPLVFGAAGLASDTIQWALWKRQLQRAADSAAIAGVYGLVQGQSKTDAVTRDLVHNSHLKTAPTVTYPSPDSPYASDTMAVRVQLSYSKRLNFSSMFLSSPPTIVADATATIVPDGKYCVISLESGDETGIDATGSTTVNLGCGGKTNSTSMNAAVATGSSLVTMTPVAAVGGIPASTHWGTGTVLQPFQLAQADPFIDVPVPTPSGCQSFDTYASAVGGSNANNGSVDLSATHTDPNGVYCIQEGGNKTLEIKGNVTLGKGTYVLNATSLSMSNNSAGITCNGCTIVLTSSTAATDGGSIGTVTIEGGKLNMTSPESGTYKGITIYQDRRATAYNDNKFNGNGSSAIEGALYFPNADLTYNGTSGQNTACLQLVVRRVSFTGNSNIQNDCTGAGGGGSFEGKKVRLVG